MGNFYVYVHLRADGTPFYVGKGKGNRGHELKTSRRNSFWVNVAKKEYGDITKVPVELIYTNLTEDMAHELEILTIKKYGRRNNNTGILTNLTDGGEGTSGIIRSAEYSQNISKRMSGKNHPYYNKVGPNFGKSCSEFTKQKLREINLGDKNPNFGTVRSLESRVKTRQSNIKTNSGRLTKKHNDKMSMSRSGGKIYTVISPSGQEFTFVNQALFAKEHDVSQQSLSRLLRGERKSYLGWTVKAINISEENHAKS